VERALEERHVGDEAEEEATGGARDRAGKEAHGERHERKQVGVRVEHRYLRHDGQLEDDGREHEQRDPHDRAGGDVHGMSCAFCPGAEPPRVRTSTTSR